MNIDTTIHGYIFDGSVACVSCTTDEEKLSGEVRPLLAYDLSDWNDGLRCDRCGHTIVEPDVDESEDDTIEPDALDLVRVGAELEDWLDPIDEDSHPAYNIYD